VGGDPGEAEGGLKARRRATRLDGCTRLALGQPRVILKGWTWETDVKKSVDFGAMSTHIAFQIHLTWRAIRKRFLADARLSEDRITRGSYAVPILIGINPGVSPQEIAAALYLDASKVTLLLRDMEKAGHVDRKPSPSDGRRVELHLTDSGAAFVARAMAEGKRLESRWNEILSDDETAELIRLLAKIRRGHSSDTA